MTQQRTLSWIFYSVALATELEHAGYSEIYERATRETKLIPEVWNNFERRIDEHLRNYAPPSEG